MNPKTLQGRIYWWTDELPEGAKCWESGLYYIPEQPEHGLPSSKCYPFYLLADLPAVIAQAHAEHNIVMVVPQ